MDTYGSRSHQYILQLSVCLIFSFIDIVYEAQKWSVEYGYVWQRRYIYIYLKLRNWILIWLEIQILDSRFGVWLCSQTTIDLNSRYGFYGVITLDYISPYTEFILLWIPAKYNHTLRNQYKISSLFITLANREKISRRHSQTGGVHVFLRTKICDRINNSNFKSIVKLSHSNQPIIILYVLNLYHHLHTFMIYFLSDGFNSYRVGIVFATY